MCWKQPHPVAFTLLSRNNSTTARNPKMSSYFTLPSFARAKKNTEDLEKTNPTQPVLNDADEKFLTKITSQEAAAPEAVQDEPPVQITDDGQEKQLPESEATADGAKSPDQIAVPETQPEEVAEVAESKQGDTEATDSTKEAADTTETAPDPPEVTPGDGADDTKSKKAKKNKTFELPSQEEAEAATKGFDYNQAMKGSDADKSPQQGEKRTWASYLPNLSKSQTLDKDEGAGDSSATGEKDAQSSEPQASANKTTQAMDQARSWAQYASTYIPSTSALPSIPSTWSFANKKDFRAEPVYNEDGSINEQATKEKQEKEVSVLLDNLSLSNINNRVFSFSAESQKYYDRFTQVLKDTLNGAPTAYEDMDKLMKDAGPALEKQFDSMPPFVQTLVKSLPAKLGATLGPELMAAASEKPGNDMKARMESTNKSDAGVASAEASESKEGQKKKRRIPGLKSLTSSNGVVASILRNIVNFLQVRFPFLVSTTNVVMSLAVFSEYPFP